MPLIIPALSWLLLFILIYRYFSLASEGNPSLREVYLLTSLSWGSILILITELLSLFKALTFFWITTAWFIAGVFLFIPCLFYLKKDWDSFSFKNTKLLFDPFSDLSLPYKAALTGIAFILGITFLTALISPPNTWDAMTYHLSRVMHWIQNRSLAYYSTNSLRQLYLQPGAEYFILHLRLLGGNDRFVNLVQWLSMFGSLIGVSLIAKALGAGLKGQILSLVICGTIPMGILQSSSTQNDYTAAFWMVCFIYMFLRLIQSRNKLLVYSLGVSLGLALLTKATAYIYLLPFLLWLGIVSIVRFREKAWWLGLIVVFISLFINSGYFLRNYKLFNKPLVSAHKTVMNQAYSPADFLSNSLKNLALHLGIPDRKINSYLGSKVSAVSSLLGVDVNDPSLNFEGRKFYIPPMDFHEDNTGNPIHLILALLIPFFWVVNPRLRRNVYYSGYLISLISAFSLFCFFLQWQPWHSRLQLPLFVMGAPLIALMLEKAWSSKVSLAVCYFLLIFSLPYLLFNKSRPVLPLKNSIFNKSRVYQYFVNFPYLQRPYQAAVDLISKQGEREIGLISKEDNWEYPFWVLFKQKGRPFEIEHMNVKNVSKKLSLSFQPDAIIYIGKDKNTVIGYMRKFMKRVKIFGPVVVLY